MNEKQSLYELFGKLQWKLHRYQMMNRTQRGPMADPHRGQGRVLVLLSMREEISQRDLLYLLDMRPQSLGELLTKLEKGGYIERTPSESDKRVMMVRLTDEGRKAASETERQDPDGIFDCLNEEEREQLSGYLGRIIGAMDDKVGDEELFGSFHGRGRFGRGEGGCHGDHRGGGCGRHPGFGRDGMRRDGRFVPLSGHGNDGPTEV